MPDLKTTQQVFNIVFRDTDGGVLDTLASEQAILSLVLDEASGRLKVQVAGGIGQSGHKLGSWDQDYAYTSGDIVNYYGYLYRCILSGAGNRPDTENQYWEPYYGALGEKYVRATWYQEISSATGGAGAIGLPPGNDSAEFVFNEWPDGIDAVVCGLDGDGKPDEATVYTSGGVRVYVPASGGLSGDGTYALSGIPAHLPCAFVYRYRCKFRDFDPDYSLRGCDFEEGLDVGDVLGTAGQVSVIDNGNGTISLAIPDPATLSEVRALDGNGLTLTEQSGTKGLTIKGDGNLQAEGARYASYLRKIITSNLTIHCGVSDGDFIGDSALSGALASLAAFDIAANATVTIQMTNEVHGLTTPLSTISLTHPNIPRIIIQGNIANAFSCDISAATKAPDTVNDYIYVPADGRTTSEFAPGGDYEYFVCHITGSTENNGAGRIIGATVDGTDIRLAMEAGTVKGATKDGTLYLLPANNCQLIFNGSSHGFLHGTLGQVRIQGLFAHGNRTAGTYSGLYASQTGQSFSVNRCIFNDWQSGVSIQNNASFSINGAGYTSSVICMVDLYGVYVSDNATAFARYIITSGATAGLFAVDSGFIRADLAVASRNTYGFYANRFGYVYAINSFAFNNTTGVFTDNKGLVMQTGMIYQGNTTDQSANGGWIQ